MGVIAHKSAVVFSGVFLNDNGHMQCDPTPAILPIKIRNNAER